VAPDGHAQSLDLGGAATSQEPMPTLDMDANPSAPLVTPPSGPKDDNLKAGIVLRPLLQQGPQGDNGGNSGSSEGSPPANAATAEPAPAQPPPEPRKLDHPTVVDTAKLKSGDVMVALFGIVGQQGEAAQGLQAYITNSGGQIVCQPQSSGEYVCLLTDGTDVAEVSLVNGAAETRADANDEYRAQEQDAQSARRGVWANLPPPPVQLKHPTVSDTATLVVEGKSYRVSGIVGLKGQYAHQLQGYIAAHDDALMCQPQGNADNYICVLPDGTDIAKEALVNGAAKVAADAPDSYRLQQADALDNKRGVWANVTIAAATSARVYATPSRMPVVPGDEADGVTYVGGAPSVVIDGAPVFLTYAGVLGWGYYDGWHHWHGAPPPLLAHMDRFHPGGVGLPGYGPVAMRPGPGGPMPGGPVPPGVFHPGGPMPPRGFGPPGAGMARFGGPGPGMGFVPPAGGFMHPVGGLGGLGGPGGFHPAPGGGFHPPPGRH
jgi:endonuclease YncB( thermonuclease family)